jgi:hypothetical protein
LNSSDRQNSTSASALSCACHSAERAKTRLDSNKCELNRLPAALSREGAGFVLESSQGQRALPRTAQHRTSVSELELPLCLAAQQADHDPGLAVVTHNHKSRSPSGNGTQE